MPRVKFAKSGDVHIAYMSMGEGPEEFLYTPGAASHVEITWENLRTSRLLEMGRLTWFDKRGTGMSDRDARFTFEERMDDIRAVLDAAGIQRAHLLGTSEGAPMSILFAVTYPQRVASLSLSGAFPAWRRQADYDAGTIMTMGEYTRSLDMIEAAFLRGGRGRSPVRRIDSAVEGGGSGVAEVVGTLSPTHGKPRGRQGDLGGALRNRRETSAWHDTRTCVVGPSHRGSELSGRRLPVHRQACRRVPAPCSMRGPRGTV